MHKKIVIISMFLFILLTNEAYAKNQVWRDPSLNFSQLKKVLVLQGNIALNAGTQMQPIRKVNQDIETWAVNALKSYSKGKIIVHTLNDATREYNSIYREPVSDINMLLYRLIEIGYQAQININIDQEFGEQYVPPQTIHYTTYENTYINMNSSSGYVSGTVSTPKDNQITIPDRTDIYLSTNCSVALYMLEDVLNASLRNAAVDYKAMAVCSVYKYYRNGPVLKVIENAIKSSMKSLVTGKK